MKDYDLDTNYDPIRKLIIVPLCIYTEKDELVTLSAPAGTKMRKIIIFSVLFFIGVSRSETSSKEENKKLVIPRTVYNESFVKYEGSHNIVDIHIPLNAVNFAAKDIDNNNDTDTDENFLTDLTVFFVEADSNEGTREYHGLFVYKNGKAKKILATGRTSAGSANNNNLVFFGASNGLYVYDVDSESAVKYGSITDDITSIATDETGQTIYILTDDHKLYKVTNNGETKELIDDVTDAQEIVLDDSNNLYYYTSNKEVFLRSAGGISKVPGLAPNPSSIKLVRAPFVVKHAVGLVYDNSIFLLYSNGTTAEFDLGFSSKSKPTAFGPEAALMQYYAIDKKLYEYNLRTIYEIPIFEEIREKAENLGTRTENTDN